MNVAGLHIPTRNILKVETPLNPSRDSYVEENFEQVLDAFKDCGWEATIDGVSDKGYASMSQAIP